MNGRIRELMIRAISDVDSIDDIETRRMYIPNCFAEKFSELIVRECAGIYDKIDNGNQHMGTDNYLEALQKHFGVKE
jgi:hypothetical protein